MADRLPPLTALRAFEAAARHMSFAQAAAELNVTPAALSFQIKSLEAHLGAPVFRRLNRAVELTEEGRMLAPGVSDGFAALSAAWRNTQRLSDNSTLTVTAGPAFTSKWLAPRLYEFAQAHPEIELRFSASLRLIDFDRDAVDVAIRFGLGQDKDVYSEPLIREWMTPMMTPDLAQRFGTLEKLSQAPLIHDESIAFFKQPTDWPAWCVLNQLAESRVISSFRWSFSFLRRDTSRSSTPGLRWATSTALDSFSCFFFSSVRWDVKLMVFLRYCVMVFESDHKFARLSRRTAAIRAGLQDTLKPLLIY